MATKIISFTSFKGGSGRTVAMSNVAFQLAKTFRVGCIDFDIEAGSLHEMFGVFDKGEQSIQHFLMDEKIYEGNLGHAKPEYDNKDVFVNKITINVRNSTRLDFKNSLDFKGELYMIKAEPDAYLNSLMDTGGNMFYYANNLNELFSEHLNLDYILIDCRSGISNLSLPGMSYGDATVICMRWARQHRYGTIKFFSWYLDYLKEGEIEKDIFLVVTGVDQSEIQLIPEYCQDKLKNIPINCVVIPEIKELKNNETIFWSADKLLEQSKYIELSDIIR